jgi:hypothetical protein
VSTVALPAADDVRRARRATALVFAVHGCVTGSFAARVPWIAGHVGVDVGHLGLALLMPGIGAMVAMPFSGRLAHRHSFRLLVGATIAAWCACLVLPALPTSLLVLCALLLVFGAAAGLADMAMNAQGVLVERALDRSIMSGLHGCWSAGVLAGSALSAGATHAGIDTRLQFAVTAAVLAAAAVAATRFLLEDAPTEELAAPPAFALPTRPVLVLGLVGLCAVFAEQAGTDWSALFLRRELGGSASVAALAVSAFAATMATVRLLGDLAIRRRPDRAALRPLRDRRRTRGRARAEPRGRPRGLRPARDRRRRRRPARLRRRGPRRAALGAQRRGRGRRRLRQRPRRPGRDRRHRLGLVADDRVLRRRRARRGDGARRGRAQPPLIAAITSTRVRSSTGVVSSARWPET